MLVLARPSSEALQRARAPGAQGQRGCPSNPLHRGGAASTEDYWGRPYPLPLREHGTMQLLCPPFMGMPRLAFTKRIERALFHRARSASKKATWAHPSPLAYPANDILTA